MPPPPDLDQPPARVRYAYDRVLADDLPLRAPASGNDWGDDLAYPDVAPARRPRRRWLVWTVRAVAAAIVLLVTAIIWLAITAPLSRSLQPPAPPSITITAADGTPIARRGAIVGAPVDASTLPAHVRDAFVAIEDRRFYSHWGVDPRGIGRAVWHNATSDERSQGASTITQQLAKNAFLDADRTLGRKLREVMIAFWLEARLTKNQILSRYLSNVYFGDNVYGLTAASQHYFGRTPARLNVGQAAMLAGLVKAPSRLAPTGNLEGARRRQATVVAAMVDAHFLTDAEAARVQPQRVLPARADALPSGTYFADWVLPEAREAAGEVRSEAQVQTTLDRRLQRVAEGVVKRAGLQQAQVALVAMHPDGRVVAMVGGKNYGASTFNRATQARRQPGSAFKLFVYLAALRSGMTPDSTVDDSPLDWAGWKPRNDDGRYLGPINLRRAFARSCNVCAARLTQQVGVKAVIKAARDLGISTPIASEATISLGTSQVSLLELTAAYAAVADGRYPVRPRGVAETRDASSRGGWLETFTGRQSAMDGDIEDGMKAILDSSLNHGTGVEAALSIPAWGKTGTTQDGRDALFIGWAKDLVVGVWVGNDDNTPNPGLHGGGVPARLWGSFMAQALGVQTRSGAQARVRAEESAAADRAALNESGLLDGVSGQIEGLGINLKVDNGSISIGPAERRRDEPSAPTRDERRPDEER